MAENRAQKILNILTKTFSSPRWITVVDDPFRMLIAAVISQNTTGKSTTRAFENLSKRFEIVPEVLANARTDQIEECLKPAGLQRNKARTIRQVSRIAHSKYRGKLKIVLAKPFEEARTELLQLPGVRRKTADAVLLFSAHMPTIPVDTHVSRLSKRLGFASPKAGYEKVRRSLQSLYNPKDYLQVHISLISLGREYCRARNPVCRQCPFNTLCPSSTVVRQGNDGTA